MDHKKDLNIAPHFLFDLDILKKIILPTKSFISVLNGKV
jgi:hypothetical protein